jgi:hypothetical protein
MGLGNTRVSRVAHDGTYRVVEGRRLDEGGFSDMKLCYLFRIIMWKSSLSCLFFGLCRNFM